MKAVIFDFDGTILDTESTELQAWQYIYEQYDCILPLEKWYTRLNSINHFEPFSYLCKVTKKQINYALLTQKRRSKLRELTGKLTPLPGVVKCISKANEMKIKLAVASSSPRYWVESHLERFNLLSAFSVILTKDDVRFIKPHPEIYGLTLNKLGVAANEAIAIEDSPNGASAAISAGICCIVIPNDITSHLEFPAVSYKISCLEKINFQNIFNSF